MNMKRKALAFFACLGIILTAFTSCHSETSTTKEQIEFADGSVMIAQNGPKYYHRLFDDYVLNSGYGYFEQVIEKEDRETFFESFADLYSYCDENAINLGEMYYAKG